MTYVNIMMLYLQNYDTHNYTAHIYYAKYRITMTYRQDAILNIHSSNLILDS